eukprot:CAMPEP_0204061324 /NCGR_PEP_ID=MMETSP0360-20130528/141860_1 /ASSEMBLY_ACC=CAM_ASM_000342 /TAXON_ID=268821 /ORGANISM="Scrippsiella Hangoei, Strain SHTV-5" /LENGTH=159 /DNA_ID=CAMNT_0051009053 /DNA_START=76 /DNA_END=556 /DNA_ORIENTATION=+
MLGVELDASGSVLHSKHGLREVLMLGPPQLARPRANLDPIAVGVKGKGQSFHSALVWLLLEANAALFELRASVVDVVDVECYVAEAACGGSLGEEVARSIFAGVSIPVSLEVGVRLSPVVVRELHCRALHAVQIVFALNDVCSIEQGGDICPSRCLSKK